jgi:hypothetical protein
VKQELSLNKEREHIFATYNKQFDLVTINLVNINGALKENLKTAFERYPNPEGIYDKLCLVDDSLTMMVSDSIKHEFVHRQVWNTIKEDKINLGIMHKTKEEWITKTVCGEKMSPFSLTSCSFDDGVINAINEYSEKIYLEISVKYKRFVYFAVFLNMFFAILYMLRIILWKK